MKIRVKQNITTDAGDGTTFFVTQGQVIDDVDETLAKRLIKDGLAVEYTPEESKPKAKPAAKTVWVKALKNIQRFDPNLYLVAGQKDRVSKALADELTRLGLAVKTTATAKKTQPKASVS